MSETKNIELAEIKETVSEKKIGEVMADVSISEYTDSLEYLANKQSDFVFSNSSKEHAAAVLQTFFNYANKEVRIYDSSLNGDISEDNAPFFWALEKFVESKGALKMVVKNAQDSVSTIYSCVKKYVSNPEYAVDIRIANREFENSILAAFKNDTHFAVADSRMIRVEPDTNVRKAYCSFNRKQDAKTLETLFDKSFDSCPKFNFNI